MKVLVIGASRGIGLEFVRQYRGDAAEVTATARDDAGLERLRALGATAFRLDVADAASASGLAWQIEGSAFDAAIVNAGVTAHRVPGLDPPAEADFDHVMRTNVLGPMRVLPQVAEALAVGGRIAVLSSRMGSIGARTSAGSSLYRASKAALNSVLKDASLLLGARAVCVAFHPGWVRTDMGGTSAPLDVATSVAAMRSVIAGLAPAQSGSFLDHDGSAIPW
ncbi:MAG TPA: SDR family oxidoreductase [Caldimonas sp.]|jgi:NAD(P)-dependent dehydrogenase (short-subunit alcohol dehydrogenase family)|nr:SDR family oxidoreductase [Caldimonas sp.]HEX2542355.1 SDR family oxidoreductase [Caldimonas sp.]